MHEPLLIEIDGDLPSIDPGAWVAPGVVISGRVSIAAGATVWFGTIARGDEEPISIGAGANVQDGCILHTDEGAPLEIGRDVTVGHRAVVHGCKIGDGALIGIGAVVLTGAVIGEGALVAAGALVREGQVVEPLALVAGVPAQQRRSLSEPPGPDGARWYQGNARRYAAGLGGGHHGS